MLRNLERDCQIEAAAEVERFVEASADETILGEGQLVSRYPRAVDADVVGDTVRRERLEPDTEPTPEVDDAARAHTLHHERDDRLRRASRSLDGPRKELGRIRGLLHALPLASTTARFASDCSIAAIRVSSLFTRPSALINASRSEAAAASAASAAASDVVNGGMWSGSASR